jgi:hypothetical protein
MTGHGYGHVVRSIQIIKKILQYSASVKIHIRTSALPWLFADLPRDRVFYHRLNLDFGVVQQNSFSVDRLATLTAYEKLLKQKKSLIDIEGKFFFDEKIDAVISDITPLAFQAATYNDIPSLAVGNFSWDWIYSDWIQQYPRFGFIIEDIRSCYHQARILYRLPFYGDMSAFPVIHDVPLVARKACGPPEEVLHACGIVKKPGEKLVLIGLREADLARVNWVPLNNLQEYHFIAFTKTLPLRNFSRIEEATCPFHEVLGACDVVVSKPGYSMVAEVIANQTPLLYVPRHDFKEDEKLREGLKTYSVSQELGLLDFEKGMWGPGLELLFARPPKWPGMQINGDEIVAREIIEWVGRGLDT